MLCHRRVWVAAVTAAKGFCWGLAWRGWLLSCHNNQLVGCGIMRISWGVLSPCSPKPFSFDSPGFAKSVLGQNNNDRSCKIVRGKHLERHFTHFPLEFAFSPFLLGDISGVSLFFLDFFIFKLVLILHHFVYYFIKSW